MLVKAAKGLTVRDPFSKQMIGDDGVEVDPLNLTWDRMLRDGDVVEVKPEATKPEPPKTPPAAPPQPAPANPDKAAN